MACVFIVSIPKSNQEFSYNNDTSKCVFEKEKIDNASKLIHELKEHKKFGSRSMELCMEDTCLSKSKSTECLNLTSSGLYKSKSSNNINEDRLTGQCMKTTWEEIKQAIQPIAKKKLKITGLGSCMDVTEANWNKPIETILSEVIANLGISNSSWSPTENSTCWQVIFTVESRTLCEELLQVFKEFGIGSRHQSSVSVLPCALHYASSATQREFSRTVEMRSETSEHDWSCFSSSPSRPNLRQTVRDIQEEAALTLNWLCLLLAAAFLATLGLVENSSVTIVASMLVSPLAAPIMASTLGAVVRDRYLQRTGLMHSMLGLFLCVVTGFISGLVVCVLDERYGIIGDWPSSEMITRCELRSIWVGILVALPSGACMALGLFGQSTNTLAGVVISASLLPPAANAGLLWAMALDRLLSSNDNDLARSVLNPGALAILGTVSLSLTLTNTLAVFLAGVVVHKVKQVCPFEQKNISWCRRNAKLIELPTDNINERTIDENSISGLNDKQCTEEPDLRPEKAVAPALGIPGLVQSDTITYRRNGFHRLRAQNIEAYCLRQPPFDEQYTPLDSRKSMESDLSNRELPAKIIAPDTNDMKNKSLENNGSFYNWAYQDLSDEQRPTLEPSLNFTVPSNNNCIALDNKSFQV